MASFPDGLRGNHYEVDGPWIETFVRRKSSDSVRELPTSCGRRIRLISKRRRSTCPRFIESQIM